MDDQSTEVGKELLWIPVRHDQSIDAGKELLRTHGNFMANAQTGHCKIRRIRLLGEKQLMSNRPNSTGVRFIRISLTLFRRLAFKVTIGLRRSCRIDQAGGGITWRVAGKVRVLPSLLWNKYLDLVVFVAAIRFNSYYSKSTLKFVFLLRNVLSLSFQFQVLKFFTWQLWPL